jgi:hypothetical protein
VVHHPGELALLAQLPLHVVVNASEMRRVMSHSPAPDQIDAAVKISPILLHIPSVECPDRVLDGEALSGQVHSRRGQADARHPSPSLGKQLGVTPRSDADLENLPAGPRGVT